MAITTPRQMGAGRWACGGIRIPLYLVVTHDGHQYYRNAIGQHGQ
jgi:hypothetical protein